ncbi:conserved hypothetical protein [Trichinella spiralis]|uniref:hypothetical protein n=1 Tax=Trichinella spiralis TaxID=6334 RepID=UPI0001EFB94B|nr:conserved hypothetical protein [Trichinella spiralis]
MINTNSTLNCEVYCTASYQLELYQVITAHVKYLRMQKLSITKTNIGQEKFVLITTSENNKPENQLTWRSGSGQMRRREAFLFKVVVGWLGNGNRRKRKQSYKSRPLQ